MIDVLFKFKNEIKMLKERVSQLESKDGSLVLVRESFTHDKWRFEKGRRYPVDQDEHYVIITDDHGNDHYIEYDEVGGRLDSTRRRD